MQSPHDLGTLSNIVGVARGAMPYGLGTLFDATKEVDVEKCEVVYLIAGEIVESGRGSWRT